MRFLGKIRKRTLYYLRRDRFARDLEEEMRFHLEMKAAEHVEDGMPPEEVRYAAVRQFGNVLGMQEQSKEIWMFEKLQNFYGDVRYGARMLRANPMFTLIAMLSLALGIGANTAIFSLMNAVLLRMIPVENPKQLVVFGSGKARGLMIGQARPGTAADWQLFSYSLYKDFRDRNQVFSGVAAIQSYDNRVNVNGGPTALRNREGADQAETQLVSGAYFSTLGVKAEAGRTLTPEDDKVPGGHPVAVISYGYWKRRFGLSPSAVGNTIRLNGTAFNIVGVAQREFFGFWVGESVDIWVPLTMQAQIIPGESFLDKNDIHWLTVIGRLKPGIPVEQASANINVLFRQILIEQAGTKITPEEMRDLRQAHFELTPGSRGLSELRRRFSVPLRILMAVVGVVLLISCANVANLLLARAATRQKEISVRLALGAGRLRLILQLLTESCLLGILGGAAGLLLALWGTQALVTLVSRSNGRLPLEVEPDLSVLAFTAAISILSGVLFGLAPALRATKIDLTPALKERSGGAAQGTSSRFALSRILVVSQVVMSLLLLVGAGLFVRSLQNLRNIDAGFDREGVLMLQTDARGAGYQQKQMPQLTRQLLQHIGAIPGVKSVTLSFTTVVDPSMMNRGISVDGDIKRPQGGSISQVNITAPKFTQTTGMRMLAGSDLGADLTESSEKLAVVNESFAKYYFPRGDAIVKRFGFDPEHSRDYRIVGVVRDARYQSLRESGERMVFLSVLQNPEFLDNIIVRTVGDPAAATSEVRRAIKDVDGNLPVSGIRTLAQQVDDSLAQERLIASLSSFFGILALLLACIGLYGVMQYGTVRRTAEFGIRMAMGAGRVDVIWLVLRETLILVGVGIAIGLPAALAAARLVVTMLYGLTASDPATITMAIVVMAAVAILAGYLPARRASVLDPMAALRYE